MMRDMHIKTDRELGIMQEGGKKLAWVKHEVEKALKPGMSAMDVEEMATKLILETGGKPSFKMVPGYKWTTCINVNDGVVHGIPHKHLVFGENDIVSVDMGLFYQGFHTDTSISVLLGDDPQKKDFLAIGKKALEVAIGRVKIHGKIGDISLAISDTLTTRGVNPVTALTGHGVGKSLHEDPRIPCFVSGSRDEQVEIVPGMALAVEVMYTQGDEQLVLDSDGWTIRTKDGKISALFEETVAVTRHGRVVLTD